MPGRCCVPLCGGNYPKEPKVSVFSFPKIEEERRKWLLAIKRENFIPTTSSKVCEKHFKWTDFQSEASAYDENTGMLVVAPLKVKRLKKGAVPFIFQENLLMLNWNNGKTETSVKL